MRKSILALAVGGVIAATAFSAAPASANHRWSPEFGWRAGHGPARVVITPDGRQHFVPRRHSPRRTVIVNPDGSRTIIRNRPPRYRPYNEQVVVVPRY